MTVAYVALLYVVTGVAVALVLKRRGAAPRDAVAAIVIWPLALASSAAPLRSTADDTLQTAAGRVEAAWSEGKYGDSRELAAVRTFVSRLANTRSQIAEMDALLRANTLAVGDKLLSVRNLREQELSQGVQLLEELAGQLVLLRFARGSETVDTDRRRIEEVLARIEALAHLSAPEKVDNPSAIC